ncbi:MAG: alpha/beta hydrolase-fold protein [Edaphobacter sp.]
MLLASLSPILAFAQAPPFRSAQVNPDRTITFRYKVVTAHKVELALEGVGKPTPMTRGDDGIWIITTKPLVPEMYGYHFEADGQHRVDPINARVKANLLELDNLVTVSGDTPEPWEITNVPHGIVHHHTYTTSTVVGLPDNQSDYYVYTPPNYDPKAKQPYPVLYLLHGWSDDASGWTSVGHANLILDNLLAEGKIKPMVVVMPLGYGEMSFVFSSHDVWDEPATVDRNTSLFTQALLTEVTPQVESAYNVSSKREDRAIAGLSMGGLESLTIGLAHSDKFAWVGGFSSAVHNLDYASQFATLNPKTADLRLLWIACGTDEPLLQPNREFIAWLKAKGMPVTQYETPGLHTWMVWRNDLIHFAPLLFQPK